MSHTSLTSLIRTRTREACHLAQQGHVPARRDQVPHHRGVHEQDRGALQLWSSAGTYADHRLVLPKRSRSAQSTYTTWSPRNETLPLRSFSVHAHMKLFDVDFVGGDFDMAVNGPVVDVFSDAEFMAPGSSPLWGVGGPEGNNVDCAGFLCMPRRPFHRFVSEHGVHTFANEQLGLTERDESTHHPVFMHLWATNLPRGTRAVPRSDAAQTWRLLKATTKKELKRQRRLDQATTHEADQTASTASAGKLRTASPTHPVYPCDVFQ